MKNILVLLALTAFCFPVYGHEFWFEPGSFFLAPKEATDIKLFVGDGLVDDVEERPFQANKTSMFSLHWLGGSRDLVAESKDGVFPVYKFSEEKPGNYLLAMERSWSYVTLDADKFDAYLREDGMEYIIAERAKLGESKSQGRERYSRFIKGLLQVGGTSDDTFNKKLGLKLELIPLENPYAKKVGDTISFQILFDGKPLVGRTVFANNRDAKTRKMKTDKNGIFNFKLSKGGLWLARLVVMQRCANDCGDADWESFWGAFSFGVR